MYYERMTCFNKYIEKKNFSGTGPYLNDILRHFVCFFVGCYSCISVFARVIFFCFNITEFSCSLESKTWEHVSLGWHVISS